MRAWTDDWATWLHAAEVKVPAGIDAQLVLAAGAVLLHRAANEWSITRGARSGRVAWQFIQDWAGRQGKRLG